MGNAMKAVVYLLEDQAKRCLRLAHRCQNKNAERILRLLAVDLMLAVEQHQRSDLATQLAALRPPAAPAPIKELA